LIANSHLLSNLPIMHLIMMVMPVATITAADKASGGRGYQEQHQSGLNTG
jgi:hypothetical protein